MAFLLSPKTSGGDSKTYELTYIGVNGFKVNGATVEGISATCAVGDTITWDSPASIVCTYYDANMTVTDNFDTTSPYTVEDAPEAVRIGFNGQTS